MRLPNPTKAIIILVLTLFLVSFYESKRVGVSASQIENPILRSLNQTYAQKAESIKSLFGLNSFFNKDESSWEDLKKLQENLVYRTEATATPTISPQSPTSAPSAVKVPPTVNTPSTINAPYNILIVGDSFIAEAFGPTLEKELLTFTNTTVFRKGIYSTGFSRPDYFNWEEEISKLISEKKPNIVFVMLGANDGQGQTSLNGKAIHYGTSAWNQEYGNRVSNFLKILKNNHIFAFWIGNPIARDQYYSDEMANINSVYQSVCQTYSNCLYLDTWNTLATPKGEYSAYLPDENGQEKLARGSDGIHATAFGSQLMLQGIMEKITAKIKLQKIAVENPQ